MRRDVVTFCACLATLVGVGPTLAADAQQKTAAFEAQIQPILEEFCYGCHGYGSAEGGMSLEQLASAQDRFQERDRWLAVWTNLRAQTMPPADEMQPSAEQRQAVIGWIERDVLRLDAQNPDPGRVTLRRLNRAEYRYTVRDLLGVEFNTTEAFPADDTGYGFDTIGDVLSVSPLLMEKYLEAAQQITAEAIKGDRAKRILFNGEPDKDAKKRRAYAQRILRHFADRAFRRPVDDATLNRLMTLFDAMDKQSGDFKHSIAHALTAVLVSPRFLFRMESQPDPNDPGRVVPLDDFALASRLSYFLWLSLPDDELFDLARRGQLRSQLRQQVDRMLADDRSQRFVESFVGQWLQTRDVETMAIDPRRVLGTRDRQDANRVFNSRVRQAMRLETEMLFADVLRQNSSLLDLLTARYTFLNEPLAEFYGIPGVDGNQMRKVSLPDDAHRQGVLTHGSFLVVTSNPTRTSPVKRGLFILENLLGAPPPPPPADVPPLEEAARKRKGKPTMRELLEVHREQPLCASCHSRMDPLGLALENYNALGMWRDDDNGQPIEAGGQLVTGETFEDVEQLADVLASRRRHDFYRCLTEKMLTFAIGRGVEYYDAPTIDALVAQLDKDQGSAKTLLYGVVESVPFQKRRGDGQH